MRPRVIVLAMLIGVAAALPTALDFGRNIQGAAANVTPADGAALGSVGFRIWSALPGGEPNESSSLKMYVTNSSLDPGGYVSHVATPAFNGLGGEPFYELADASMNDATGNHIGFFGVSGITADGSGVGNPLLAGCPGTNPINCFGRIDDDDAGAILMDTRAGYGGPPHTIRPIGGLNPIPVVRVSNSGCGAGQICLSWLDPPTYAGNMRPGSDGSPAPPSPVKGVRMYKNFTADCTDPAGNDPGWTPIGSFNLGQNETRDPLPLGPGCNYYALTVRLVGPTGDPNEIETFRIGAHSQGVGGTQTTVRIVRFGVSYIGHQIVNVTWQSGVEGDVQGYYVTRSMSVSGPYERVSGFIRATGDQHPYAASDRVPMTARAYYYRLEILLRDGGLTTSSSATAVVPARGGRPRPSVR